VALFTKDSKVEALRRAPLFEGLSKKHLTEIAGATEDMDFPAGKELCREGASAEEFFVIMDGNADITRNGEKLATRGSGDFVGEIALVANVPRTATVTTTTPVRAFVLTRRRFLRLLDEEPAVGRKVLQALANRLATVSDDPAL
jgi:CRP/FNR family cyclic AMP-dependent transcriptional regulator